MIRPSGPCPANIMIVGEAPGEQEERAGEPFVGASGQELNRMLGEAGINRAECFVTNVCRVRPPPYQSKGRWVYNDIGVFFAKSKKDITPEHTCVNACWVKQPIIEGLALLETEIKMVRPNIIIALGNTALWALTGNWGIVRWRGSMLSTSTGIKVLPTYHPAAVLRQWDWRAIAVHDLKRAAKHRDGEPWLEPGWVFHLRPTIAAVDSIINLLLRKLASGPVRLSIDIETKLGHIDCLGIAWSAHDALCIPFMGASSRDHYWPEDIEAYIVSRLYRLLTHPNARCIFQNGLYDTQYIYRSWHFIPRFDQDTMISHHTAFCGLPKKLDFQASMYCKQYVQWKPDRGQWKEGG